MPQSSLKHDLDMDPDEKSRLVFMLFYQSGNACILYSTSSLWLFKNTFVFTKTTWALILYHWFREMTNDM